MTAPNIPPGLTLSICVPNSCTEENIQEAFDSVSNEIYKLLNKPYQNITLVIPKSCQTTDSFVGWNAGDVATV